jgi:hypothetical protein
MRYKPEIQQLPALDRTFAFVRMMSHIESKSRKHLMLTMHASSPSENLARNLAFLQISTLHSTSQHNFSLCYEKFGPNKPFCPPLASDFLALTQPCVTATLNT